MASKRVLSIELGMQTSRICEMDFRSKKPTVYKAISFDTPEGAVEDGYIRNREILSVAIKEALAKNGIKTNAAVFVVSSSKIANREVNMPVIAENKIKGYIDTNAKEYFPVDIDEYIITHKLLEKVDGEEKSLRVLVLAAPTTLIESYYDLAKLVNFEIVALDYVGNACYETVKRQTGEGVNIVVQLNEQNTLINILDGETLALQRTVPYGMNAMIEAALNCGEFDISDRNDAIEKLCNEPLINSKLNESVIDDVALNYMENNDDSYALQLKQMKAKDEITETFNYLISNVVRVLDYYAAKNPEKKVSALHLSGIGSRIKGISHLFKNEIFMDIDKFENLLGIVFDRGCMVQDFVKSDYAVAIGAAIDPVDFIPKEHLVVAKKKNLLKTAGVAFVGCVAVAALLIVIPFIQNTAAKAKKSRLEKQIAAMADVEAKIAECNTAKQNRTNAEAAYVGSLNINYLFNNLIAEIEAALPPRVSVNSISVNGNGVTLNLGGATLEEVGETIVQLKNCALIDTVNIGSISTTMDDAGISKCSFSLSCTVPAIEYNKLLNADVTESFIQSLIHGEEVVTEETAETPAEETPAE
ncbi:MAG: pilus assembly protein PilM [Lachnospiraceae bacterium]|nr:pilus assembly protein PilM [Lachnospiraceae bacterium]